jgi:hypothetical protein
VTKEDIEKTYNPFSHVLVMDDQMGMMGNIHWLLARKTIEEIYTQSQSALG